MKLFCLLAGLLACGTACAQQSAASPSEPSAKTLPGISTLRPEYAPSGAATLPRAATTVTGPRELQELTDLVRAQTEAIRALSVKVDMLDDKLRRMENRVR